MFDRENTIYLHGIFWCPSANVELVLGKSPPSLKIVPVAKT